MRTARILGEESAAANFYHVCSRAIEGRMILQEPEVKEHFRKLLAAHCEASGIHLVTWCAMDNHFHLLLEVPNADEARAKLDDEEILRRLLVGTLKSRGGFMGRAELDGGGSSTSGEE